MKHHLNLTGEYNSDGIRQIGEKPTRGTVGYGIDTRIDQCFWTNHILARLRSVARMYF